MIVRNAGVLGLDSDEARIAGCNALPRACSRVGSQSGGDDEVRAVASKTELRERACEVGPPISSGARSGNRACSCADDARPSQVWPPVGPRSTLSSPSLSNECSVNGGTVFR